MKLTYGVKDRPTAGKVVLFAIQQLLAILAATIAVPAIIGNGMSQSAALFGAGAGTIIYLLFTKFKSPVFLGSSFAFISSMFAAFAGAGSFAALGYLGIILGAVFAGLVYVVIALIVKLAGVKWINKLMPAVVIGPTVAIIGLSLAGNAVGDLQTANYVKTYNTEDYAIVEVAENVKYDGEAGTFTYNVSENGDMSQIVVLEKDADVSAPVPADKIHSEITASKNEDGTYTLTQVTGSKYIALICGLITLAVTILVSVYSKKTLKTIPFIIGILAGYATAACFTLIGSLSGNDALMIIDFSKFSNMQWLPDFAFLKAFSGEGIGNLNGAFIGTVAVAYIPVAFVVFAEHIADHKNISSILSNEDEKVDLLEDPGLSRTLLGDGVGSMVGAFFGGCPNTTYGESIGCVAISGNASIVTILCTAILAMAASFVAPFVTFLSTIPSCVMGGVCIALYGFIAVSGLKMVQKVDLDDNRNLFVVSVILITGIGGLAVSFGKITITSIACALILGILTNLMLSRKKEN